MQGGRAPTLVTQAMVDAMKAGSVIVDLAADGGGNCEATKPGELVVTEGGVKILGFKNWPGRIPVAASNLYSKNLLTFLTTFWDKDAKAPKLPEDDDIVKGVMLTRGGRVVHSRFAASTAVPDSAQAQVLPSSSTSVTAEPAPHPPSTPETPSDLAPETTP